MMQFAFWTTLHAACIYHFPVFFLFYFYHIFSGIRTQAALLTQGILLKKLSVGPSSRQSLKVCPSIETRGGGEVHSGKWGIWQGSCNSSLLGGRTLSSQAYSPLLPKDCHHLCSWQKSTLTPDTLFILCCQHINLNHQRGHYSTKVVFPWMVIVWTSYWFTLCSGISHATAHKNHF